MIPLASCGGFALAAKWVLTMLLTPTVECKENRKGKNKEKYFLGEGEDSFISWREETSDAKASTHH